MEAEFEVNQGGGLKGGKSRINEMILSCRGVD